MTALTLAAYSFGSARSAAEGTYTGSSYTVSECVGLASARNMCRWMEIASHDMDSGAVCVHKRCCNLISLHLDIVALHFLI